MIGGKASRNQRIRPIRERWIVANGESDADRTRSAMRRRALLRRN